MSKLKVPELKAIAKQQGVPKYYAMCKADLIKAISSIPHGLEALSKAVETKAELSKTELVKEPSSSPSSISQGLEDSPSTSHRFYKNKYKISESKTAIKGFAKQYVVNGIDGTNAGDEVSDAMSFLNTVRPGIVDLLAKNREIKVNLVLSCEMERVDMKSGEIISIAAQFVSKTEVVLEATDVNELYNEAVDKIMDSMAMFQMRGSNWRFKSVQQFTVNTGEYKPLRGNSYIELPKVLVNKKARRHEE